MRGLIVHEWLEERGGAEKVLDHVLDAYPDADVLTLWNDAPHRYGEREIRESFLARTPLRRHKALALAAMPLYWRSVSLDDYDWVLVSSHALAHQVGRVLHRRRARILVYVHSPARYLWASELDTRGAGRAKQFLAEPLRRYDRKRAQDGAAFAANSEFVRARIVRSWGVQARVIHPPVDVPMLQAQGDWARAAASHHSRVLDALPGSFLLGASRFVPYKQLEKVIEAGEAIGVPVVLAGGGPDERRLRHIAAAATVPITFIDRPSSPLLYALMQRATAFVFPAVEDFGIMPVEAAALGTPVVVNIEGGAAESLAITRAGGAVDFESRQKLGAAVERAIGLAQPDAPQRALAFAPDNFLTHVHDWIEEEVRV